LPHARLRMEDEREALELSKYGAEPAPHSWDIGQELDVEQTFLRRGLGRDILVKLRRGHWVVQAVIDLHGMTTTEAHDALGDFLLDARNRGVRCVRVIHGKGLTSPNREPVLKGKVRRWLAQWDDVLAYCEAVRHAGGSGAVVVLLRGR
jgi:DNA-nicking Smr family endonuclease